MIIETLSYKVNWRNFKKGYSFFVPCIDEKAAKEEVMRVARRLRFEVVTKIVVQDGVKGLRVWRT